MNRLLIRLWGVLENDSPDSINYQIANTLMTNIASIEHTSSAALAHLCHVSKPSISRFCKNLGYDDFYDFRAELNQYCPDRGLKYQFSTEIDQSDWVNSYLNALKKNFKKLHTAGLQKQIEMLVQDIHEYHQVYLLGNMQSGNTASNLHYNLHVVKKNISAITGLKEQRQVLESEHSGRLIVIFSVSGEYFYALFPNGEVPRQASGSKLWLITTSPEIRKVKGIDVILNCGTGTDLAGSNICLEIVSNLIAYRYWDQYP